MSAGSVQSKVISLLILATTTLTPVQLAFAAFRGGSPTVPNANFLTGQAEDAKIDGSTGAFTQRISFDIPPGRNSLQPDVSLQYNSQRTQDSVVGYGWSLSIPYIERLNKTGSQNLYASSTYYTSSIDGELAPYATSTVAIAATTSPSILDSVPLTWHTTAAGGGSFTYTVPAGGNNKVFVISSAGALTPTVSLNGVSITMNVVPTGQGIRAWHYVGTLLNPTSGTLSVSGTSQDFVVFTLQDADQTTPLDTNYDWVDNTGLVTSITNSIDTTVGNDAVFAQLTWGDTTGTLTWGDSGTGIGSQLTGTFGVNGSDAFRWKLAGGSPATETLSASWVNGRTVDEAIFAIKGAGTPAVTATSTVYGARIDDGSFNSYSISNNTWTVYDKKGTKYTYGSSDSGRMYDSGASSSNMTYRWMLQEVRDTNDNYITYTYLRDNNQLYPYKITYTGHGSIDGIDTVTFATSTRTDSRTSYAAGFAATTTKVISQIIAAVNGVTVRQYDLTYSTGHNGTRSLLTSVQQKGYDDNTNLTALPATSFTYTSTSTQHYGPAAEPVKNTSYVVANSDGDGINDVNLFMQGAHQLYMWHDNAYNAVPEPSVPVTAPESWGVPALSYRTTYGAWRSLPRCQR